jgi:hypothetical protein
MIKSQSLESQEPKEKEKKTHHHPLIQTIFKPKTDNNKPTKKYSPSPNIPNDSSAHLSLL